MTYKTGSIGEFARNSRESCVPLSAEEYHHLKRRDRKVLGIEEFTATDADAVRQTAPSAASAAFDHELTPDA